MRSLLPTFRCNVLIASVIFLFSSIGLVQHADAQPVCHDGNWDPGEFCGRDAWLVTGKTEMNHDCFVDILDLKLFAEDYWSLMGGNESGDINGDGTCNILDFPPFVDSWLDSVSPCSPGGMLPDLCQGTIALSFNPDSTNIVSTATQSPGSSFVYLVIDGWTDAEIIEYAIEASPNIRILIHGVPSYPHWSPDGIPLWCDPDSMHSYRSYVGYDGWPSGPINFSWLYYELLDSNPAWFKITTVPSCFEHNKIRWTKKAADRTYHFATVLNAGINGPAPPGEPTCPSPAVPVLDRRMLWALVVIMMALAIVVLRRKRCIRA
jgi:hypothetical protein